MNCCKNKKNNPFKFLGAMGVCCLLPIILIAIVPLVGVNSALGKVIPFISPFICPILMGTMLFSMSKGSNSGSSKKDK